MISRLDIKLARDLRQLKGQAIAVSLVMACGLAMMIMSRSLIYSLDTTCAEYYRAHHFADVFLQLKRAPLSVASRAAGIPGIAAVESGISIKVTLDIPGLEEPASGRVRSVPERSPMKLNQLFLRSGEWLNPSRRGEILVGEAFADANELVPGDKVAMLLYGKREVFRIAGVVLSPEFVFTARPGSALPDDRTYGIFWMPYEELAAAVDMDGAFNYLSAALEPGAKEDRVIAALDQLTANYGAFGAYGREDHPSDIRVSDEIRVLRTLATGFPIVFLSVAAFMINAVLSRLLALQREQIAILKAFGFSNHQIQIHYLKFAMVMVAAGTVLGSLVGVWFGQHIVEMYHLFFRFPTLDFHLETSALGWAFLASAAAAVVGVFGSVRRAAALPPAEAMRPEPPANFRPAILERAGIGRFLSLTFRIAMRNMERKPVQAFLTVAGLALATGILVVPNCFRDGVNAVLDFQWDIVQRQDVGVSLIEPENDRVKYELAQLPGVIAVEPSRSAAVRIHFGHRRRQLAIQGLPDDGRLNRVIDAQYRRLALPSHGLVLSAKLAEALGAKPGDPLVVEVLEGKRPTRIVPLVGLAEDFAGVAAYMDLKGLNDLLGEGDLISSAGFQLDSAARASFLKALKEIPRASSVAVKDTLRDNFKKTTAASINLLQSVYMAFAIIVAFGVVYNNARISLAERSRELATLRVIGFSKREVGAVLVTEIVSLALIAGPLGLLTGTAFATGIVGMVNTETVRLPLVLTAQNFAFAISVVTVASVLSALVVLRRLNHLDLVSALKAPE